MKIYRTYPGPEQLTQIFPKINQMEGSPRINKDGITIDRCLLIVN